MNNVSSFLLRFVSTASVTLLVVLGPARTAQAMQESSTSEDAEVSRTASLPDLPALPPPRPARTHVFVVPGYLLSLTPAVASESTRTSDGKTNLKNIATGHGIEVSMVVYPPSSLFSYGAFMQAQRYYSYNGNHNRFAMGLQGGWMMLGAELGLARRTADEWRSTTNELHFGVYVSTFGFLNVAGRFGFPLFRDDSGLPGYPIEASLVIAAKVPIPVWGFSATPGFRAGTW